MAQITFKGNPVHTSGTLPPKGERAPDFELVRSDLSTATLARYEGKAKVLNIFPSIDTLSTFRSRFGDDYGVRMTDGPLAGLLARAVVVLDRDNRVVYSQLVPEIAQEPDYEAALAAVR
jgi:thiol peroxidase